MNFFEDVKDRINDLAKSYSQNTDGNEYGDEYVNYPLSKANGLPAS